MIFRYVFSLVETTTLWCSDHLPLRKGTLSSRSHGIAETNDHRAAGTGKERHMPGHAPTFTGVATCVSSRTLLISALVGELPPRVGARVQETHLCCYSLRKRGRTRGECRSSYRFRLEPRRPLSDSALSTVPRWAFSAWHMYDGCGLQVEVRGILWML